MGGSGEVRKIVQLRARDSHHALYDVAFSLNTLSSECDIDAVKSQATNSQVPAISFKQSRNPCCVIEARLDKACDDHAVRSPQPEDRDLGAGTTPAFAAGRYHPLAKNDDLTSSDVFDGSNNFTDHFDVARGQRAVGLTQRQNPRDLPDPQRLRRRHRAIDQYRHIRRVADAFVVDENASEALDHPDDAGAANAAIIIAADDAGPPDALIVASLVQCSGRARSSEPKSSQQQPPGDDRLRHD
jgi:hypothetical protein